MKPGRDALPRVQADRQVGPTGFMDSFGFLVSELQRCRPCAGAGSLTVSAGYESLNRPAAFNSFLAHPAGPAIRSAKWNKHPPRGAATTRHRPTSPVAIIAKRSAFAAFLKISAPARWAGKAFANHDPQMAHGLTTMLELVPPAAQALLSPSCTSNKTIHPRQSFIP